MLKSLPPNSMTPSIQPHFSAEVLHPKKSCIIKKKINHSAQKSSQKISRHPYFNVYNIIYFDVTSLFDSVPSNSSFLQQIFKFQNIAKVCKTRDRTILSLKLGPQLTKQASNESNIGCPVQSQKEFVMSQIDICEQKKCFKVVVQKIHNILHDQQALKQNLQTEPYNDSIYLSDEEVSRRTEEMIANKKYPNYILLESMFKLNCKKIKNIHISNSLLETIGHLNQTLVFDLLQKRCIPFNVFKEFDQKLYAKKSLIHFGKVLEQLFNKAIDKTHIELQTFDMKGIILTSDQQEKNITVRWTCSHPSIILIEMIDEVSDSDDLVDTTDSSFDGQDISTQFQDLKVE